MDRHDFADGSVARHIVALALPMTAGQLVQMTYSLVDRIYIGHLEEAASAALTGLGLTFPFVFIVMAVTQLFGTGALRSLPSREDVMIRRQRRVILIPQPAALS